MNRIRFIAFISVAVFLTLFYFIYTAIYPGDRFYKQDFTEVTGVDFPDSGEILWKKATYPDQFGDYESLSIIKVSPDFYHSLPDKLIEKGFKEGPNTIYSSALNDVRQELRGRTISTEFALETQKAGGVIYYVGFLSDHETLIVQRASW